ncbi:MAG: C25 family cysteine peptidase [Candidatus Thorarchaeota archaeon]|nr:C25 family cysteine peptidase [Candidatus Thorarchaeota archaeon]
MKKVNLSKSGSIQRLTAIAVSAIIIISSFLMFDGAPIIPGNSIFDSTTPRNIRSDHPTVLRGDAIPSSNGGNWIDLGIPSVVGTPAEIFVSVSNETGITVISNIYGFWYGNITYNNSKFNTIDLPAASPRTIVGQPQIPRLTFTVEVPSDVDITINILSASSVTLGGYNITPTQIPSVGLNDRVMPLFSINATTYSSDLFYPNYNFTLNGQSSLSPIVLRGRRLLQVSTFPIQASPGSGQLKAYTQFEIRINYDHVAQIEPVDVSLVSNAFESLYQRILLNYRPWVAPTAITTTPSITIPPTTSEITNTYSSPGALSVENFIPAEESNSGEPHYLIIYYDEFLEHVQRLADWKTQKGIFTHLVPTSDIFVGVDSVTGEYFEYTDENGLATHESRIADLKTYIDDTVLRMTPVPTYILLFGDASHIPCDYSSVEHTAGRVDPSAGMGYHGTEAHARIATDVTYFCVQGDDFLPEFYHGRISVESNVQAGYIVDKIIAYEQQLNDHDTFYNDILVSSFFDDWREPNPNPVDVNQDGEPDDPWIYGSDGISDEPYISTTEEIYNAFIDNGYGYSIHKNYARYSEADFPLTLYNGDSVSTIEWGTSPTWNPPSLGATTDDIRNNILAGRFLMYHIDHGVSGNYFNYLNEQDNSDNLPRREYEGWDFPAFMTTDFGGLECLPTDPDYESNLGKYPLILSMDCNTGWFDGETDGFIDETLAFQTYYIYDCFAEEILRIQNGGAVAVIAPTRISYNLRASGLMKGITNAFWPDLELVNVAYPEDTEPPINNLGIALYLGKYYIENSIVDETVDEDDIVYEKGDITNLIYQLFGDPETSLWTEQPTTLQGDHSPVVCIGSQDYSIRVYDEYGPVEGAKVCLYRHPDIYEIEYTNSTGYAVLHIGNSDVGRVQITITKLNSKPYISSFTLEWILCPPVITFIGAGILIVGVVIVLIMMKRKR